MERIYVLDCGANTSTVFDSAKEIPDNVKDFKKIVDVISHSDVLDLHNVLEPNSTLVCEYAHLGCPRQEKSLSQPFTAEELLTFYYNLEEKNITLKLFPQQSTPRALAYSGFPKSDINDPIAIYKFLKTFPKTSLMKPKKTFEPSSRTAAGWEIKDNINHTLNIARRYDYLDESDENNKLIESLMTEMQSTLSETTKEIFGINKGKYTNNRKDKIEDGEVVKKGWKKGDVCWSNLRKTQLYSVLAVFQDHDGDLRTLNGKLLSWKFAKRHIFCFTPFHFRGGVARSNLVHHGQKNFIIKKGKEAGLNLKNKNRGGHFNKKKDAIKRGTRFTAKEDAFFVEQRKVYQDAVRELYRFFENKLSPQLAGLPE